MLTPVFWLRVRASWIIYLGQLNGVTTTARPPYESRSRKRCYSSDFESRWSKRPNVTRSAIFLLTSTSRKPAFNARSCPRRYERKETVDIAPPPSQTAAKTFPGRYSPIMAKQVINHGVSAASLRCSSTECAHRLWRRYLYVSERLVCRKCYINIKYVFPAFCRINQRSIEHSSYSFSVSMVA